METYELILNNEPGALARVVTLVTGRRWKLGSLSFPEAGADDRRRLTLGLDSGGRSGQVEAQLAKLYDVLAVKKVSAG